MVDLGLERAALADDDGECLSAPECCGVCPPVLQKLQRNPRAHKNKIGTPPPKNPKYPPPLKRGILWTWLFLQNGRIFPGVQKIGAAISGPRIADKNFMDTRIFLQKLVLCLPFLCGWWGSSGQQIQANVRGPMKHNASPGTHLRLRDKGGDQGRSSTQNKKTRTVSTC